MTQDRTLVVDGLHTRVRVQGEGPPLLLIGGIWSQVGLWEDVLRHPDDFTTITFDPPGIGETDLPPLPYSVRRHGRFAAQLLEALGIDRAHVVGVSLGGAVAQELARAFPERVDRLVLVSSAYGVPAFVGRPGVLLRFMRPGAYRDLAELERNAGAIFGGRLRREPGLVHQWHLRPPRSLRAYLWRVLGTIGWSSLPWLHRITRPTLVLHGDDDPIVPLTNARVLAWRLPLGRLHIVDGGGHLMLLDSAGAILPVITTFLKGPRS